MTENFCYNQIGINHILKQFGDAISNKQYKNPIPYDTYRKIRNGFKNIFILFDCGDILVKAESETLFHTSYKDNGFGQFFYDNYVSTTKTVETKTNIKENDTMKMPAMNFDFGPFTESGVVALSPYGIAVLRANISLTTQSPVQLLMLPASLSTSRRCRRLSKTCGLAIWYCIVASLCMSSLLRKMVSTASTF